MLGKIGTSEIVVVLVILLLLFGGKKLPELAKGLGEALNELRKGFDGDKNQKSGKNTDKSE